MAIISEDDIEQALLTRLKQTYGYELLNCFTADADDLNDRSNRSDKRHVVLADRLRNHAIILNPDVPEKNIDEAVAIIMNRRSGIEPVTANRELDGLIRDGVPVEYDDENGRAEQGIVKLIDFDHPEENDFLAVSQLWIKGDQRYRRPDVILYVNGLPLVFIELKNSNVNVKNAYDKNLADYNADIPQLFHCNAFCILSNALKTRVGSFTAGWEHFFSWMRIASEKEEINRDKLQTEGTSLEIVLDGLCEPTRLLDYVENFIIYHKDTQKIIAQNHQFLGVNNALETFKKRKELKGKLGVFWHTQGSGKSFSMIFYSRKIHRKIKGNFTFLVVTDRDDLDGQIYRNFLNTNSVKQQDAARPKNSAQLRDYLGTNKKAVFTLIQKFRYDKGKQYPQLSDRDEIIVIVDEAHRTQYKSLAENMRAGLPNAQFLAFTGTPLLGSKRQTNKWFGDYVSEYNFQQSMQDGATVPLFYEKRVPSVLNQNDDLSEEFIELLEDENLDEKQQEKLENKFAAEVEVIKRDDRLDTIAKDIVYHFPRRGYLGKAMVVSVDKFTAVKMYDKVQYHWKEQLKSLRGRIKETKNELEKTRLKRMVEWMRQVEMAVVISEDANEKKKFAAEDLDISQHRERMNSTDVNGLDVEHNFKDPEHPLQLVFVCAMWLTGFDAPTVSTLYLDKPMKDHTLMQTIARANRVAAYKIKGYTGEFIEKRHGDIVDYYNVFRNMKKALRDYAQGEDDEDQLPVQEKSQLFVLLDEAITKTEDFCLEREIDLQLVLDRKDVFKNIGYFNDFADKLLSDDEWRKTFNIYENTVTSLYEASKPEILQQPPRTIIAAIQYLRGVVDSIVEKADIAVISAKIGSLLDESVVVDESDKNKSNESFRPEYEIIQKGKTWDLSKIDFDKLKEDFKIIPHKNIEIADLREFIDGKIAQMMEQNKSRIAFAIRLQKIIDQYNSGASSVENYYEELVNAAADLKEEDQRHVREGLTEDELELYDLLYKPKLTKEEEKKVKLAAKHLLARLKDEQPKVLIQDWWKNSQTKEAVRSTVSEVLNEDLPESYDRTLFQKKCDNVYELIYDLSATGQRWAA
ncbi:MAG: deoxyribonuclease [Thiotrichaceae bacterium]|nr:MAG: deoxyribonuclease [Thiotrichaceae bacterium]